MKLSVPLQTEIVDFLASLPSIQASQHRQALIESAGLDHALRSQISFETPSLQFFQLLVPILIRYGKLEDGRSSLEAVLEAAKAYVGKDKKTECDKLLQKLHQPNSKSVDDPPKSEDVKELLDILQKRLSLIEQRAEELKKLANLDLNETLILLMDFVINFSTEDDLNTVFSMQDELVRMKPQSRLGSGSKQLCSQVLEFIDQVVQINKNYLDIENQSLSQDKKTVEEKLQTIYSYAQLIFEGELNEFYKAEGEPNEFYKIIQNNLKKSIAELFDLDRQSIIIILQSTSDSSGNIRATIGLPSYHTNELVTLFMMKSERLKKLSKLFFLKNIYPLEADHLIVLKASNIKKSFKYGRPPFTFSAKCSLQLGKIIGIFGLNGSGKTTLLRILAGELSADSGSLEYPLFARNNEDWYHIKQQIAYIPDTLYPWETPLKETLHYMASIKGLRGEENNIAVEYILRRLGLENHQNNSWGKSSAGYKLRFELAKSLIWRPKLLILDEPLANLDVKVQKSFLQQLRAFVSSPRYPMTVVISSQQVDKLEEIADYIIVFRDGEIIFQGDVEELKKITKENIFELSSSASEVDLESILKKVNLRPLQKEGLNDYLIYTKKETLAKDVLLKLLEHDINIKSFKDRSYSIKKLFYDSEINKGFIDEK